MHGVIPPSGPPVATWLVAVLMVVLVAVLELVVLVVVLRRPVRATS
ncbi:hypothetical protein ACTWP5_11460 [Streptomyces sp. 4N509B]